MSVVNIQVLNVHTYTCRCVCFVCPESESLSLISLFAQHVCVHVCVCMRVCVCVRVQVTQMKHRLMQTNIEQAFLLLIKNSVRRIKLESERRQSL